MTSVPAAATWQQRAVTLAIDGRAVIDGERRDSASGKQFTSDNPATGSALAEVALCDSDDVDHAVASGRRAFASGQWSRADTEERKAVLLRLAHLMEGRAAEFALLETLDMGKPVSQSSSVDVPGSIATFRWSAELTDKLVGEIPATPRGSVALVTKEPLGVVGAIVPWNYPLEIATWKLAPALAVGRWQQRGAQTRHGVLAHRPSPGGTRDRGRPAGRGAQCRSGFGCTRGRGSRAASRSGCTRVHRLNRGIEAVARLLGSLQPETTQSRSGRQELQFDLRRHGRA